MKRIREIIYQGILIDTEDVNDTCMESRISSLEEGVDLDQFIAEDLKNDERMNERLRLMDERFDQLDFQLKISDDGGRIDTLESELSALEELVKERLT